MKENETYRPANIDFDVAHDGTNIPETLGEFETAEDATKFLGTNFTTINQALTVARHMDIKEKTDMRREYNDLLENILPGRERELSITTSTFNGAKSEMENAKEMVNATVTQVRSLAKECKRGLVDMRLDGLYTCRLPYRGRYYFYTYIDKQLKLCKIQDIPEREKAELWNKMAANEEKIDKMFGGEITDVEFEEKVDEESGEIFPGIENDETITNPDDNVETATQAGPEI